VNQGDWVLLSTRRGLVRVRANLTEMEAKIENLFAYGTLMCDDIMREVAGCPLSHGTGTLKGYRRRSVKGEHYPALVPDEDGRVDGVVYHNVPASAWDRLDRFEGELYERRRVRIELDNGTALHAAAYVVKPEYLDHLEPFEWDFAEFLRNGKARFQKHYKGFRIL